VTLVDACADGAVAPAALAAAVRASTALVALMLANNETGAVSDVAGAAAAVRAAAAAAGARAPPFFLCDASQAAGKVRVDAATLGADALVVAGHKLGAPKGVGATVLARGAPHLPPLLLGGGQERGARAGTENVALAAALGAAADAAAAWLAGGGEAAHAALRARLAARLVARLGAARVVIHGPLGAATASGGGGGGARADGLEARLASAPHTLSNTLSVGLRGARAAALVTALGARLAFSAGAACHAGEDEPSHVLAAMGVEREAACGTVRLSLARGTTADEVDAAADLLADAVEAQDTARAGAP